MGIVIWAVLGLIAGAIAKAIYPGEQGGGILGTMALGIVGSLLGGFIGKSVFGVGAAATGSLSIPGIITAVVGAIIVVFIWGLITKQSS
ncbi:MAG: GlsB/YeaQ/YmgE family stress response membrane protein [Cyanobacteria bacterium QH_9_48_43]|nr:MAG: GlsB/YeaQ/YmgE family stress response membrane protein [Cyanobacteria bacterium QS_3_48_167]PSO85756.1 MAG: GlsB/YeaQ/YmgE family stress response membrane protein [Cyanobacteria bacterium QH_9_48_43]PSP12383.1 MAG: GlsB/YeaQ/YmgE family stress response membrane protein [Cyanobacteria bacterium SW_9_47_5]